MNQKISPNKDTQTNGLLFIGDPHLSSRKPGRRTDVNFAGTVLNKLAQAFDIAREHGLQPVILGDLFDRAGEQDLMVLSGLLHLLRDHRDAGGLIPVTLAGNHDMKDATLSGDTALSVIHESGLLRVLEDAVPFPAGPPGDDHQLPRVQSGRLLVTSFLFANASADALLCL